MKTVFSSHEQVIHVFAQQTQEKGRANNVFFEGKKLYSYGYHFCLAEFLTPEIVWVNNGGYSVSTSKHQSITLRALRHKDQILSMFELSNVKNEIDNNLNKLKNARKPEIYINEINYYIGNFIKQNTFVKNNLKGTDYYKNNYVKETSREYKRLMNLIENLD